MAEKTGTQRASGSNGITKMEAVRRALKAMGRDAKPAAMQPFIKREFGVEMSTDHISTYKGSILKAAGKTKKAAMKQPTAAAAVTPKAEVKPVAVGGVSLHDLQVVKDLVGRVGANALRALIDLFAR
jgi:hypothetical protein